MFEKMTIRKVQIPCTDRPRTIRDSRTIRKVQMPYNLRTCVAIYSMVETRAFEVSRNSGLKLPNGLLLLDQILIGLLEASNGRG